MENILEKLIGVVSLGISGLMFIWLFTKLFEGIFS
jgi:hypothetical protein